MEELISYRARCHVMNGTIAAFTEQQAAQPSRCDICPDTPWRPSVGCTSLL